MVCKKTKSDLIFSIFNYLFLVIVLVVTFYPFWYVFIVSINDPVDTIKGGLSLLPRAPSLYSYGVILRDSKFMHSILITVMRTVVGTPLTILCTAMISYVFTRRDLVGYKFFRRMFVFTMYFGGGIIPMYMTLKFFHLTNNFWVYILPGIVGVYYMILITAFMDQLPRELEESAMLDGSNDLQIFFRIILPLSKPILATITLFVAINHWNSFFDSYLYTSNQKLKTLQAVMMEILNQYQTSTLMDAANAANTSNQQNTVTPDSIRMAATMVSTIPIIMVYPFVQKYFVQGMMIGAVKA